ncbi:zinc finger protein 91-like isoform X1 [Rhagoletis pomonella]|uniref:zinc finger protein 91-like isoform X1 n=1 Tax=Rhagoletis pomonella TaxID=28610 RepID=UPI00177A9EE6|nr:zinc finger protein 91-like isoform X1 [Rhagoletis pomonella]
MDLTNICRACLSSEDREHLLDWYQPVDSLDISYKECFCKCTQINLSLKDDPNHSVDPNELDDTRMQYLCFDCAQKLKDAYDFIEKARRADNELRRTQTEKVKIESIAKTFEWVPVHEELMEVNKPPDPVDMDHMDDIKVPPSMDVEHEINIDKKRSVSTTMFLIESDKDMQRCNNLNEAGLVLSKKSKRLNLAHTRPKNVKTNEVKSEVKTKKEVKDMSEPAKCEECGKIMKRSSLKQHKQRHKPKPFLCQACPKTFMEFSALKNHELSHNGKRERFPCDICNQSFVTPYTYKKHKLTHENNRKPIYQCSQCEKSFLQKNGLTNHELHHKGVTIECQICQKRYVRQIDLDVHLRTHSGESPFSCHLCEKSFIHKRILNRHMQNHGYFSYKCLICGSKFSKYDQYHNHRMQHTGLPYKCGVCEKQFPDTYKLVIKTKRHIRGVHKIGEDKEMQKLVVRINITKEYRGRIVEVLEKPDDDKPT